MAQAIAPDARVVYVDNDPVACSHGQALLGPRDKVGFVLGDLRRPAEILRLPDVLARIDFSRPVGVLCACALHFVPDQEKPHQVIAEYRDHLAPGSYLAITGWSRG
jgi:SAM-dependent methyltransferase